MEPLISWSQYITVHQKELDNEHKLLFEKFNTLYAQFVANASYIILEATFDSLIKTVTIHFTNEEAFMEKISYPEAKEHALIHKKLLERVTSFYQEFKKNKTMPTDLFPFLKFWLNSHTMGIDRKYAEYALDRNLI